MTPKRKSNRDSNPEVLSQLKEWAALKTRVVLEYLFGWTPLAMAGELHPDRNNPHAFFFTTWGREIMVTIVPGMYESQSLKKVENSISVVLRGFGGEIAITELTSRNELLFNAAPTAPPPNTVH